MQDDSHQGENNEIVPDTDTPIHDDAVIIPERSRLASPEHTAIRERPEVKRELEPIERPEPEESRETDEAEETQEAVEESAPAVEKEPESSEEAPVDTGAPAGEQPQKPNIAEDISTLTGSSDEHQVVNKRLASLPFPWFRTILVGFVIPILTVTLIAATFAALGQPATLGALTTVSGWLIAVPVICGLVVVCAAAWLLKRMDVGRAFFLSAGTLICSAGIIVLFANEFYPALSEVGLSALSVSGMVLWVPISLILVGALVILVLIFVVHSLGRYMFKLLTVMIFLAIVAAPWLVHFYGDDLGLISQKSDIITASVDVA